jgi:hypothetical protein
MKDNGQYKSMSAFAAEHDIGRQTVADIVAINNLPSQQIGKAKGLPPATQKAILRILGIKPGRTVASAN